MTARAVRRAGRSRGVEIVLWGQSVIVGFAADGPIHRDATPLQSALIRSPRPALVLAGILLAACSARGGDDPSLPRADARRRSAVAVTELAASGADAQLTQITALDGDSRGRTYVGDWLQHRVVVLGADGRVAQTIGREGAGPGEFRAIRDVQILPGDSLLVYDPVLARVSVFAPGSARVAYTVGLPA